MLLKSLLFFLILFSLYVFASGEKNCSSSFQSKEGVSHKFNNSISRSPAKGPKRAGPHSKRPKRASPHLSSSGLLAILNNPSSSIAERKAAVQQTSFLKEARGVIVLERALDDPSVQVRKVVIKVAVDMGEIALNVLNKALLDSSPAVQKELMRAIALMSDKLIKELKEQGLQITLKSAE